MIYKIFSRESEDIPSKVVHHISPENPPFETSRTTSYGPTDTESLATAQEKALDAGMLLLTGLFMRPYQYIGMPVKQVAKAVGGTPNRIGNIIVDNDLVHLFLEAEGNLINYVDIELKQPGQCPTRSTFDPVPVLGVLSINPSELAFVRSGAGFYYYDDHRRKMRVSVACNEATPFYTVRFSPKYYQSP